MPCFLYQGEDPVNHFEAEIIEYFYNELNKLAPKQDFYFFSNFRAGKKFWNEIDLAIFSLERVSIIEAKDYQNNVCVYKNGPWFGKDIFKRNIPLNGNVNPYDQVSSQYYALNSEVKALYGAKRKIPINTYIIVPDETQIEGDIDNERIKIIKKRIL